MPATALAAPASYQPPSIMEALQKTTEQLKLQLRILDQKKGELEPGATSAASGKTDNSHVKKAYDLLHPLYMEAWSLTTMANVRKALSQPFSPSETQRLRKLEQRLQHAFGWLEGGLKEAVSNHQRPMTLEGRTILNLLGHDTQRTAEQLNHLPENEIFLRGHKVFVCDPSFNVSTAPESPSFLSLCDYSLLATTLDPKRQGQAVIRANAEEAAGKLDNALTSLQEALREQVLQLRSILLERRETGHRVEGWKLEEKINRLHGQCVQFNGVAKKDFKEWPKKTKQELFDFADQLERFFHRSNEARLKSAYEGGTWIRERLHSSILSNPFFGARRPITADNWSMDEEAEFFYEINPLLYEKDAKNPRSFLDRCDYSAFFNVVSALRHAEIVGAKGAGRAA